MVESVGGGAPEGEVEVAHVATDDQGAALQLALAAAGLALARAGVAVVLAAQAVLLH